MNRFRVFGRRFAVKSFVGPPLGGLYGGMERFALGIARLHAVENLSLESEDEENLIELFTPLAPEQCSQELLEEDKKFQ